MKEGQDLGSQVTPILIPILLELQHDLGQAPSLPWPQPPSVVLE